MYANPSARNWKSNYKIDPAVLDLHRKLPNYAQTPLRRLSSELCSDLHLQKIFLKDEANRFGLPAFKILGASWASYRAVTQTLGIPATSSLQEVKDAASGSRLRLHAATEGNFGRAIARMATFMGIAATIHVPKIMVEETRRLIASEGAIVDAAEGDYAVAVREAEKASRQPGGLHVQDDAWPGYEEIPQVSLSER